MARPLGRVEDKKDRVVHVRVTEKEYQRMVEAAKAKGWPKPADFIRWAINHATK